MIIANSESKRPTTEECGRKQYDIGGTEASLIVCRYRGTCRSDIVPTNTIIRPEPLHAKPAVLNSAVAAVIAQ